jgi:NAD-dependent SIR2 family protein deacetylase
LERVVGIPPEKIVEAHGTFFTAHCLDCQKEYSLDHVKGLTILLNSHENFKFSRDYFQG